MKNLIKTYPRSAAAILPVLGFLLYKPFTWLLAFMADHLLVVLCLFFVLLCWCVKDDCQRFNIISTTTEDDQ